MTSNSSSSTKFVCSLEELHHPVVVCLSSDGTAIVGAGVSRAEHALSGVEVAQVVSWDFVGDCVEGLLHGLVTGVGISGQDPDVLDVVDVRHASASIDHGVAVVVSLDDFVVARGDEEAELDLEVALVFAWVNDGGLADGRRVLPLTLVFFILAVQDVDAAIVVHGVLSGVAFGGADGALKFAILVAAGLVPQAEVAVDVEVLLELGLLADASAGGLSKAGESESGDERFHE